MPSNSVLVTMKKVSVFAPATVANLGPGFDVLAFALDNPGDTIEMELSSEPGIVMKKITGDGAKLPCDGSNTVCIAAADVMKKIGAGDGVEITLHKNMPLGSGMGSSGASAVGGAYAVNVLFGEPLKKEELVESCLKAEIAVSGCHADNVASSMMGGFVIIQSYNPFRIIPLGSMDMHVAIVNPHFELPTKVARSVIPQSVPLKDVISNAGNLATIIAAIHRNDAKMLGLGINDRIVEPARAHLIPGFYDVKKAALDSGAFGCTISGAGPSVFAVTDEKSKAEQIGRAMAEAFSRNGLNSRVYISGVSKSGARMVKD